MRLCTCSKAWGGILAATVLGLQTLRGSIWWSQVLEILNDTEVRRLHEDGAPEVFGAEESTASQERVPFWQWATGRQQQKAEMA